MKDDGFTLIELIVSMAILAILSLMLIVPIRMSMTASSITLSKDRSLSGVRDVLRVIRRELEMGSAGGPSAPIGVVEAKVRQDGKTVAAGEPGNEITFQIPLSMDPEDATGWSLPITYRLLNEDVNGNGLLDSEEDVDGDGALTRRVLRLQDIDGDDETIDFQVLGGTNSVASLTFSLNADKDIVTVVIASTAAIGGTIYEEDGDRKTLQTGAQITTQIYLLN